MAEVATLFAASAAAPTFAGTVTAANAALPWLSGGSAAAAGSALPWLSGGAGSLFSLSNLTTGMSLASMAGDIFGGASAGRAAADQLRQQAQQDFLTAKQEELQGQQEQNDIRANLLQTIASQRLAYSGAGIDFSFGTPASLEQSRTRQAEMQLSTSRDNARLKTLARRRQAYLRLSQTGQAQSAPLLAGLTSAGRTAAGMLQ